MQAQASNSCMPFLFAGDLSFLLFSQSWQEIPFDRAACAYGSSGFARPRGEGRVHPASLPARGRNLWTSKIWADNQNPK